MKRKHFLSLLLSLGLSLPEGIAAAEDLGPLFPFKIPPYLKPGDRIGITAPAGHISESEITPALNRLKAWGFEVQLGTTIGKQDFTFAGSDEERLRDFQGMLDAEELKAILCARGGYGSVRIIDRLDFSTFIKKPKWVIGFSDITVIHHHLAQKCKVATLHSKMCNSFPENWDLAEDVQKSSLLSIKEALIGQKMKYISTNDAFNRAGSGKGFLLGGNLKTMESLSGTSSQLQTKGSILFLEDAGEYVYSVDRMLRNLKRSGRLDHLQGLIIGGFNIKPDDEGEVFGRSLQEIVLEIVKEYSYPVCFGFPVGHQKNNMALKCGVMHSFIVNEQGATLSEV